MILVGLGSNVEGPWGSPAACLERALAELAAAGVAVKAASAVLATAPFGKTDQPAFANAVAMVETGLSPQALLALLHGLEARAGRIRAERWGPRTLDLDLLDHDGRVEPGPPVLPHPGMAERAFVLAPIAEIAPGWRHPVSGLSAAEMLAALEGKAEGAVLGAKLP